MTADWIWILCLFKESNISQPLRQPKPRLSAMCSCQETLAGSGVFPKGFDTWSWLPSLIFNLWCFPGPVQVVDCAAFPLCAKNVPSSAQIYSSQRCQWEMAVCGNGRGDWGTGNGSLDWRALLGCQAGLPFQKRSLSKVCFRAEIWLIKEGVRGNAIHTEFAKSLIVKYFQNVGNHFSVTPVTQ